jgi:hypothetical protein
MAADRWIAFAALALGAAWAARAAGGDPPPGPEVGKPAPPVRLNDHTGKARRVGAGGEKEWAVLAFFPKAMTPG